VSAPLGDASAPVIITLKRRVTFQAPGKPGTVPEGRRHWSYNNDPHFAVSHQQDGVSSEDSDLLAGTLFSALQTRVCRQWPTHSPTQSEQWALPKETRRPEYGTQHSSEYRMVGRHIRTSQAPPAAWCSRMKTVFTLMKLTRRHAPSLHLQRSAVRSLTKISRIIKLLSP